MKMKTAIDLLHSDLDRIAASWPGKKPKIERNTDMKKVMRARLVLDDFIRVTVLYTPRRGVFTTLQFKLLDGRWQSVPAMRGFHSVPAMRKHLKLYVMSK